MHFLNHGKAWGLNLTCFSPFPGPAFFCIVVILSHAVSCQMMVSGGSMLIDLELVIPRRRLPLFPLAPMKVSETMLPGIPVQIIMSGWKLGWEEVGEGPHWPNFLGPI